MKELLAKAGFEPISAEYKFCAFLTKYLALKYVCYVILFSLLLHFSLWRTSLKQTILTTLHIVFTGEYSVMLFNTMQNGQNSMRYFDF